MNINEVSWRQTDGTFIKTGIDLEATDFKERYGNRMNAYWSAIWKSVLILFRPYILLNHFYNHYKVKSESDKQFLIKINYFEVTPTM